ncbi:DUF975 family protein [Lachnospiraceae bacterium 62-26]
MNRREIKARGRQALKRHYMILVMTGLIAVFLGLQGSSFDNTLRMYSSDHTQQDLTGEEETGRQEADTRVAMGSTGLMDVLEHIIMGDPEKGREISEKIREAEIERSEEENRILGRSRGALSKMVNAVTSGSLFVMFVSGINSLSGSDNLGSLILVMLALAGIAGFYLLIVNTYAVISARMFLEGRCYEKLPIQRFIFLLRARRWIKVSMAMLLCAIYQLLWIFTLIGGPIKYYSYYLVPYILAENPDLTGREAVTLSRKMMRGHKWECFVMECSFIGWWILGAFTLGLSEVLFSIPYQSAAFCEYYVYLRDRAKSLSIPGAELLNDRYLYETAPKKALEEAYADVIECKKDLEAGVVRPEGIRGLISGWFGISWDITKEDRAYEENRERQVRLGMLDDVVEGKLYPVRLSRFPATVKQKRIETFHYMRHYSVWSLILLFFIFSIFGWCWEVSIHLVLDGVFVNRGTFHGPWLPIYGAGGVLLLTVLNRVRSHPVIEFFSIMLLCGIVEYGTSYYLEKVYDGKKWWDYSGYFLNLNGRICAEGLLVFGIGGMVIVYVAAPLLDNWIGRLKKHVLIYICLALLGVYIADCAYSAGHPNEGKGITDYQPLTRTWDIRVCKQKM